jgi:predicted enzyme related to lactoylglutathione lyase
MALEESFINGGMMKREGELKNPIITIDVPNIEEAFDKIVAQGGKVIRQKIDAGDMGVFRVFQRQRR